MVNSTKTVVTLNELAQELRLPKTWLRSQAEANKIPCVRIGRRYRFNPEAVAAAIAGMAAETSTADRRAGL